VQVDRRQNKVTDEAAFRAARGFAPESMPDGRGLTGDTADGIPGLPGFGEKSASVLVGAYAHIEAIPVDAAAWTVRPRGAEKLAATLAARRADALFYRRLATLVEDAPVAETLDELRFGGVPRARFEAWCREVGSTTLSAAPRRWAAT
jgi:5'-3' exonuclease